MFMPYEKMKEFHAELEALAGHLWIKMVGQLHDQYREAPVWILVNDATVIDEIYWKIRPVLLKYLDLYSDSRPTVGFSSKIDQKDYIWAHVDEREIRNPDLPSLDDGSPGIFDLREEDVFGVNENIHKKNDISKTAADRRCAPRRSIRR